MKPASKYVSFENMTYDEKKESIYHNLIKVSSEEFVNSLIETGELEIKDCVRYKDSIGCPVVYIGKIIENPDKPKDKTLGREVYREINMKFPLLKIMGIIKNKFNQTIYPIES